MQKGKGENQKQKLNLADGPFELGEVDLNHKSQSAPQRWTSPGISGDLDTYSNEKIYESAFERLMQESAVDATNIGLKVESGVLYLSGKVNSKKMKTLAGNVVKDIPGVNEVRNELNVMTDDQDNEGPVSVTRKDLGLS